MSDEDTKVASIFDKDIENFGKDLDKMIEHLNIVIATHNKQVEEIERLNNIIEEIREYTKHKIVECYDEGSTIGEFYKICDIDSKIEELLHKGEIKSE